MKDKSKLYDFSTFLILILITLFFTVFGKGFLKPGNISNIINQASFLAIIGVFPRLMGRTGTRRHLILYETVIVAGGILGNVSDLYEIPLPMGSFFGTLFLGIFGLTAGIFVGCLVMSLAETLKALPVISRRIHLAVGLQYMIISIAAGKLIGCLTYFWNGFGAQK